MSSRFPHDGDPVRIAQLVRELAEAQKIAQLGSWEWDVASNRVTWSDQLYRIYGLPVGSAIDFDTFLDQVHPEDRPAVQESVGAALAEGSAFEFQHRIVRPDGGVLRLLARGEAILGPDGAPIGMRGTGQDITTRFEADQQLHRLAAEKSARLAAQEAEARMTFLAGASAELGSSLDYETTLRTIARLAVPAIADWCAVDLLEHGELRRLAVEHIDPARVAFVAEIQERYPPDPDAPQGVHQVIRTGRSEMMEEIPGELLVAAAVDEEHLRIIRELDLRSYICVPLAARGTTFGALTLVYAESGRRYGREMLVMAEDLARRAGTAVDNARLVRDLEHARASLEEQATEMEIQAEEVEVQNEELENQSHELIAALKTRSDFMATVSHELRTPLNAIMGYTQLLEMGITAVVPEPALAHVRRIGLSARHLLQLIDDILTFSALEANRQTIEPAPVSIPELLDEVSAIIEPIAERNGLDFEIRRENAPDVIETDPRKVRQILLNLLGNAVKFTTEGSVALVIRADRDSVVFEVTDTGMGIPVDEQHQLFEPYWQSNEARNLRIGGAGLGLTISHRFARLLGGDLDVRSTSGVGSTFTLRLPRGSVAS